MNPQLSDERLEETLHSYDTHPEFYAEWYQAADLSPYREEFMQALPNRSGRILDGGCGPGRDSVSFHEAGLPVVGLDLSAGLLAAARRQSHDVSFVNADLRQLPFRPESFSGVWLCSSLVHLPPDSVSAVLRETRRVLEVRGVLFASVMYGTKAGWRPDQFNGRRWFQPFTEAGFVNLVESADLSVIRSTAEPGVAMGRWVNVFATREVR